MPKQDMDDNKNKKISTNQKNSHIGDIVSRVAKAAKESEAVILPTVQMVTFNLDNEEYASIITDLREIIRIPDITPIPGSPEFIKGILNLRGQIVMVIDLEKRFELNRDSKIEPKHIIIAEVNDSVFGLTVDEVSGVIRVPEDSIKPTPQMVSSKIHTEYLKGVVIINKDNESIKADESNDPDYQTKRLEDIEQETRLLLLLDVPKMLAEQDVVEFESEVMGGLNNTSPKLATESSNLPDEEVS
jgi:purine-binding chemotaxis protein CheW